MRPRDLNLTAYEKMEKSGELEKYGGQYLAFVDGRFARAGQDEKSLLSEVCRIYPDADITIFPNIEQPEIHIRSPHLIRSKV